LGYIGIKFKKVPGSDPENEPGKRQSDLKAKAKGAAEKQVLAWWLRKRTMVSRRWISEKLKMGDLSRVTNAVRKVDSGKESEIRRWKMQLEGNS
jgi:hypothetical protein